MCWFRSQLAISNECVSTVFCSKKKKRKESGVGPLNGSFVQVSVENKGYIHNIHTTLSCHLCKKNYIYIFIKFALGNELISVDILTQSFKCSV